MKATLATTLITLTLLARPATAQEAADDAIDQLSEVTYLVFNRKQGFDRPSWETDLLEGTIEVRFRRVPANWRGILHPQLLSERKRRFFRGMDPIVENDRLVGIQIRVGMGAFAVRTYVKRRPYRWVMRIGELRRPPFEGPTAVPIIPYSDLVEDDTEGRDRFAAAEHDLIQGDRTAACRTITELRGVTEDDSMHSWLGLREADCLIPLENFAAAEAILSAILETGHTPGAIHLARLRLLEISGRVLHHFDADAYDVDPRVVSMMGTVADEIAFREARARLFTRDIEGALEIMESLHDRRSRSPIFEDRRLLEGLRWRAVWDAHMDQDWLRASRIYLSIPAGRPAMPNWLRMHQLGADALREVGLSRRATRVYLTLLRTPGADVDEVATMVELAETYLEAGDVYRSAITVKYIEEKKPKMARHPTVLRLRGRIAQTQDALPEVAAAAEAMASAEPAPSMKDGVFVLSAAADAMDAGEVTIARTIVAESSHPDALELRRQLDMAAGDCDAVVASMAPLHLEDVDTLVWVGACLMGEHRAPEAKVFIESARVYAGAQLLTPELDPLMDLLAASSEWFVAHDQSLAALAANTEPSI